MRYELYYWPEIRGAANMSVWRWRRRAPPMSTWRGAAAARTS